MLRLDQEAASSRESVLECPRTGELCGKSVEFVSPFVVLSSEIIVS